MSSPFTPDLLARITTASTEPGHPLLFGNARIITDDPLIGEIDRGDVLLGGSRVVGIGPGLLTAADDDGAIVIDCDGHVIVPLTNDLPARLGLRSERYRPQGAIAPGNTAGFAVLAARNDESALDIALRFAAAPETAAVIVIDGTVRRWGASPVAAPAPSETRTDAAETSPESYLGTWIDKQDFVHQHLTADGRYDETRGGRPHAYQGSYWISGNRIDYLDDLGFWAFGEFVDGVLHHAGYTFRRS
ncbi:Atu4866 domain-containing protein [Streptomyces brasiliensis]|uniref:Uncharacterized protein n=1 Tax=Streptomyces brasiliensis TaxID=1954 RepID=A0A917L6S4_9ACTN|nr:Atu4866 domain-containing protein [Streptomyces brasiliensis]GGJ48691.1 hypothetical protein GCM10010121_069810 [Streptomyces brasiliensis]